MLERLRSRWFPTGDDKVWKQWVDFKKREEEDLLGLLTSDVRDSFKRRAIFLLLVPSAELNPIYWTGSVGRFHLHQGSEFLKALTPDLLVYATDLVIEFYAMVKPTRNYDASSFYNNCILVLLALLPSEQGERIFPLFSLRDISTYISLDFASGYNPFMVLLSAGDIDEKWKQKADGGMRVIIGEEITGKTKPREEWENALRCYANIIDLQLYGGNLNYGLGMFADQMRFLTDESHYGHELIHIWNLQRIFGFLSGEQYRELRRRIANFVVLGNGREFSVYDGVTLKVAEMMLGECQEDQEIARRIRAAIEKGKIRLAQDEEARVVVEKVEGDILSKMR